MSYFFESFPKVDYDIDKTGKLKTVINPLVRYQFRNFPLYKNKSTVFYDHVVEEGERPDITADTFYGDSTLSWVVLFVNEIIDPLYDWPLDYLDFKNYISNKYKYQGSLVNQGGIEWAQSNIHHYEWVYQPASILFDGTQVKKKFHIVDESTYNSKTPSERRAVSYYTHEDEINSEKRNIRILSQQFLPKLLAEAESIFE
jgi:hypothetical protein